MLKIERCREIIVPMVEEALTIGESGASMENDAVRGVKLKLAENESGVDREAQLSFFGL